MRPMAMNWKSGFLNTCRLPLVATWAMPRPAMNSTSVAMIGWIENRVTSTPLNQPNAMTRSTGKVKGENDENTHVLDR